MTGWLPKRYKEEILYGVCSRYIDIMGFSSSREVMEALFDSKNALAVVDLPSHLKAFIDNLPPGHNYSVEDIVQENTLFPLFSPFLPKQRHEDLLRDMTGINGPGIKMRIGLMASSIKMWDYLRYCPLCVLEDRREYHECYWHRIHQTSCIYVCPHHHVWIKNSSVSIALRSIRYEFIAAENSNLILDIDGVVKSDVFTYHLNIAEQAQWLLENYIEPIGLDNIQSKYSALIHDFGYANYSGRIKVSNIYEDFKNKYPPEFLKELCCSLDENVKDNWLFRILRRGSTVHHPIRHILLMNFLNVSVKDFLHTPRKGLPFGKGPWPCLNPICRFFEQLVIRNCEIRRSKYTNGRPIGVFQCGCGFTYSRTGPDLDNQSIFKIGKILTFGKVWEEALKKFWPLPQLSLRELSHRLGVDPTTAKRHAKRLGLQFPRPNGNRNEFDARLDLKGINKPKRSSEKRNKSRQAWEKLVENNPEKTITELRKINPGLYIDLYRYDKEWLNNHTPKRTTKRIPSQRIDWNVRDKETAEKVILSAARLRKIIGKPIFMSITAISREAGCLALIEQHIDKLPETQKTLLEISESREEYRIRRVWWAADVFIKEGVSPKRWELMRTAGIKRSDDIGLINQTIDNALQLCQYHIIKGL